LNSKDPARSHWATLQSEMFERAIAGDSVFDQIERIDHRPDSPQLAELLEVHALCLLLGYQGRYAMESQGELDRIIRSSLSRISRIRGERNAFSPSAFPVAAAETSTVRPSRRSWWLAVVPLTLVVWIIFSWHLSISAGAIRSVAERVLVP
jgi:type VI secretion system protein ImpK